MTSKGSRIRPLRGAIVVLAALAVGVLASHFIWTSTSKSPPDTANRLFGPLHSSGSAGGVHTSCSANGCSFSFGSGSNGSGNGSGLFGSGNSAPSGSSGNVASSITSKVDPGLVIIDTNLGYEQAEAAGTGMVVTSSGEVFTNNHVITGATKIMATDLGNGQTYVAHVVGYDYGHDIAVLQLENASGLKTVSLADSSSVKVGQSVATIGNAGGSGSASAASGTVSALGQSITASDEDAGTSEQLHGLIGLAGDLVPGDSGGPLVNSSGDVVGMDTAASSTFEFQAPSGESDGFAIPINEVKQIASDILAGNKVGTIHLGGTGFLGVSVYGQNTTSTSGADVESVLPGTPAAKTELGPDDVITAVDGTTVTSATGLTHLILNYHPGTSVQVAWQTPSGSTQSANVTLASGPPQ